MSVSIREDSITKYTNWTVALPIDEYSKTETFSVDIEAFIDYLCQLIDGDLGNSGQAADDNVGRLFRSS